MNVLPKFSYLFQCLPVYIPMSFFKRLDSLISSFIWNNKSPRLSRAYLQRPKVFGGMALPNFQLYYWAANIRPILHWLYEDPGADAPSWYTLEAKSCAPSSLSALIYAPLASDTAPYARNILVRTTLKIWKQVRWHYGWHSFSMKSPIHANHMFPPSLQDSVFLLWQNRGLRTLQDLFVDGLFASFQQMSSKFLIPHTHFFQYLQLRDFTRKQLPHFPEFPPSSDVVSLLAPVQSVKGII